jgi:hypothetical protein
MYLISAKRDKRALAGGSSRDLIASTGCGGFIPRRVFSDRMLPLRLRYIGMVN